MPRNEQVIKDVRRIAGAFEKDGWLPRTPQDICNNIFRRSFSNPSSFSFIIADLNLDTVYMGMATQSSQATRDRAKGLAKAINSYHTDLNIDDIVEAQKTVFSAATGLKPQFKVHGGTNSENLGKSTLYIIVTGGI